jgi:hypothetical protein
LVVAKCGFMAKRTKRRMTMKRERTLSDLVAAVAEQARNEAECCATVVYMINSGAVRLCGDLEGARVDLGEVTTPKV